MVGDRKPTSTDLDLRQLWQAKLARLQQQQLSQPGHDVSLDLAHLLRSQGGQAKQLTFSSCVCSSCTILMSTFTCTFSQCAPCDQCPACCICEVETPSHSVLEHTCPLL